MSHIQFTRDARVELAILLNAGKNQTECDRILGIDSSSVCGKVNRNKNPDGTYRVVPAHLRAMKRRKKAEERYRKIENEPKLRRYIAWKLRKYWSPEQIAGRLKMTEGKAIISHKTI